jgi:hypothetical protein
MVHRTDVQLVMTAHWIYSTTRRANMKALKLFMLMGSLCVAIGTGCAADIRVGDDRARDSTSQVEQNIDDLCDDWSACYAFCRSRYQCPPSCSQQLTCLTSCDNTFAPAPEICPYP